ncbi:hypothetical protein DVH05_005927 [Phytophthora capsici]|nr:hypothetical protein DVH05_005923 [Phytophthora capsici]KAG1686822.1 hypothetical protein DVH05_005927 [Phytophthora capsici]
MIQGTSAVFLKGAIAFDGGTGAGNCPTGAKPGSISTTIAVSACSDSLTYASGVGQVCGTEANYFDKIATTMGAVPYVTIPTFTGDTTCTPANIATSLTYAADGACHPDPAGSTKSFKVFITPTDTSTIATIKSYPTLDCTSTETIDYTVTSSKLSTAGGCEVSGSDSILFKASWVTAVKAATSFDGNDCTKANLISLSSGTCSAINCANGAKTICTTNLKYESAISTAYGTTPYVTGSTYSDAACTWSKLTSATAYAADGKCRVITSGSKYYKVFFSTGTDDVTIKFFTDSGCTTAHSDSEISITQQN